MSVKRQLYYLVAFATLIRCIVAFSVDLGNDEVYYITYAQHLQWNYFDHPPMVALLIRLTTFNLQFTSEFFVRLGPVIFAAINTLMVYQVAKRIKDERAGLFAALLFTASPYCSVIAGLFIMPDAPQLFFWILSLNLIIAIVTDSEQKNKINLKLIFFGITVGLCTMSKIHGIFLWVGLLAYILCYSPKFFLNRYLYFAGLLTAIVISPILIWNIQNHFITYNFHSSRVTMDHGVHLLSFCREALGGMLYNNPVNYLLIILALLSKPLQQSLLEKKAQRILLSSSLPLIVLLLFISLFRDTLPHWSGPAYTALIVFTATRLTSIPLCKPVYQKLAYVANCIIATALLAGIFVINNYPGTLGKQENAELGSGDFTLDMYGWKNLNQQFSEIRKQHSKTGISTTFVISDNWFPAAHIDHYIAQPLKLDFLAIGKPEDIHTYAWLNPFRKAIHVGDDAWYITSSNHFSDPHMAYKGLFNAVSLPVKFVQKRNGHPVRIFFIYLLRGYKG